MPGLQEYLKALTPIRAGNELADELTATRLNAIQELLRSLVAGRNIGTGGNIFRRESPSGYTLYSRDRSGSESIIPTHPFSVTVTPSERAGDTSVNLIVEKNSWLMESEQVDSKITITGLGAAFEVEEDDKVWLETSFDTSGVVTSCAVRSGEGATTGEWEPFPDVIKYDNPSSPTRKQEKHFHLLAYFRPVTTEYDWPTVTFGPEIKRQLVETTFTNLVVCRKCYEPDGELVRVLAPWFMPYFNS